MNFLRPKIYHPARDLSRTKSHYTHFESQWSQHTLFGSRKVATYLIWVAQNCNISSLGRANSHKNSSVAHTHFESQWLQHTRFGSQWSQPTHFESQWSQHTLFGSRKVATYLIWVAQNCNISSLGRANSHKNSSVAHTHFESQWLQHTRFGSQWSQPTHFESQWSQHKSPILTQDL